MANFTLTVGADTVVGGAADDTVNGTAATLSAGDSLTGGAGTDTLALSGNGTFRVDQLSTFTGFESITLNAPPGGYAFLYLGSQSIGVTGYGLGPEQVFLGSGAVTFHGGGGSNYVMSTSASNWNAGNLIDGAGSVHLNYTGYDNATYDLTTNTLTHVNYLVGNGNNLTVKVNSAVAGGIAKFEASQANAKLVTSDAALDLSHSTVAVFTVASTNASGTNFTVHDIGTALRIVGGAGQDTITAQGFVFTPDQRNAIFATTSVEKIVDSSGTYMVDIAPTITSNGGEDTAAITVAENSTAVTTVTATDPDAGQTLSYSIIGGADSALFGIDATTGVLAFNTAPNFEAPGDTGANNIYDVTVQVSDGHGGSDTQAIAVTVTNGNDAPTITSNGAGAAASVSVAEDNTAVTMVTATDPDAGQALSYSIIGGADADKFAIDSNTGKLRFITPPNFEASTDADGNNIYDVTVQVSDGHGGIDTQVIAVTVQNGTDTIQSSVPYTLSANVENLSLTGSGNITGTGNALNNAITGNSANNVLAGLAGADTLDGGLGTDTASYATSATGINVSLATGHGIGGDAQGDTLINIENLTGSSFEDTLEGNGGNNVLAGGASADRVSYEHAAAGVTVILSVTGAQNTVGAGTDTLSGFENLTGSDFNDTLTGSSLANVLVGGAGNDIINGGAGNDTLQGGAQDDVLIGGAGADALDGDGGNDTASYATATAGVAVSLQLQGGTQNTVGAGVDTLTGIENLIGSAFNDTLTGDAGNNVLTGGAGNDMLIGGIGNDTLDGGAGTADTASYATAGSGVTVNLALAGQDTAGAGFDTLIGIERLIGSSSNDTLTGDRLANRIDGGAGDDTVDGGAGNDILIGGLNSPAGDTVSYTSSAAGVTASLAIQDGVTTQNTLGAGIDVLSGFENLTGSAFNDTLTGSGLANVIMGGAGNDIINGGAGNDNLHSGAGTDTLKGGIGNDMLTGGTDADAFVFNTALNALTNVDDVTDFEVGVDQIGLENLIFTKLAATGTLSADFFHIGTVAADSNDFIIYDDTSGALYYDSATGQQVQFAHLDPGLTLTHTDFFVV